MKLIASAILLFSCLPAVAATKVTFPPVATSLYGLVTDQAAAVLPAFLEDALLRSPAYEVVRFEDEDDVAEGADAIVSWKLTPTSAAIEVKTKTGEVHGDFQATSGVGKWDSAALGALDLVLAATKPATAEAQRLKAFAATRKGVLTSFYFVPGIVNTVNANDGELRFNRALEDWKASRKSKLLAATLVAAARRREENPLPALALTSAKAVGTAMSVLFDALEGDAAELAYPFLKAHEKEVRASLARAKDAGDGLSLNEGGDGDLKPGQRKALDFLDGRVAASARRSVRRVPAKNPLEHPYLMRRRLERACEAKDADTIAHALDDRNFTTRLLAVRLLAKVDSERGRAAAVKALGDRDEWVRFEAARVLAASAGAAERAAVAAAAEKEENPATKLYLADACARAEGREPPAPPPAANVPGADGRITVWSCGYNGYAADVSPYTGYYTCDVPKKPKAAQARKNASGACVLPRMWPAGNPGHVLVKKDSLKLWRMLLTKAQLPEELVPFVDGCVYGEENMNLRPDGLWTDGWRFFCIEEKIDEGRVKGERKNLSDDEEKRFVLWAQRLAVEGFNEVYDFTKAYFGKLRPGFLVCTFIPGEVGGQTPFNRDWKFDLGGAYVYDGDIRGMIDRVRYFKITWPERPVLWLGYGNIDLGIGGSVHKAPIRYTTKLPAKPFAHTYEHYYANNVAAWIAGADTGMFTHYEGGLPTGNGIGSYLQGEDIAPGSPALKAFVDYLFTGAERDYAKRQASKGAKAGKGPALDDGDVELEDRAAGEAAALVALRKSVTEGFLHCQRATDDAARVFRGLVRPVGEMPAERQGLFTRTAGGVTAYAATADCTASFQMVGCELLTGEWDAIFDARRKAALVAEEHVGPYVAIHKGIAAFARERPFDSVTVDGDALVLRGRGEVRVTRRGTSAAETVALNGELRVR